MWKVGIRPNIYKTNRGPFVAPVMCIATFLAQTARPGPLVHHHPPPAPFAPPPYVNWGTGTPVTTCTGTPGCAPHSWPLSPTGRLTGTPNAGGEDCAGWLYGTPLCSSSSSALPYAYDWVPAAPEPAVVDGKDSLTLEPTQEKARPMLALRGGKNWAGRVP